MKKIILGIVLLVVAVAGIFLFQKLRDGHSIDITQEEIQKQLSPQFPLKNDLFVFRLVLSNPKVQLKEGSDRLDFSVDAVAGIPTQKEYAGSAQISGKVRYEPEKGEFFLSDSRVESIQIPELKGNNLEKAREFAGTLVKESLERFPLYRLDTNNFQESLAKSLVRSVKVVNGKLRVTIGVGAGPSTP